MVVKYTPPMTAARFYAIQDRLGRCELVRGKVVRLPPAGWDHGFTTINVGTLLANWAKRSRRGRVFGGELGVVTRRDPDTVRGVDVAYYTYERLPRGKFPPGFAKVPPNLAVEIVGTGKGWKSLRAKADEYLRMGVDRVWIVNPRTRQVHVLRPDAERVVFTERQKLVDREVLPGFACAVSELFDE
jgi:Uma2 family endonuclease